MAFACEDRGKFTRAWHHVRDGRKQPQGRGDGGRCSIPSAKIPVGANGRSSGRLDAVQHNEMRHHAAPAPYEFVYVRIL